MDRLTTGKAVSEMNMIELAYNSCYAKDRKAHIRDFKNNFDTRELTIKLLEKYADIPNEFTCDEDFDDFMLDSLQYGMDSIQGLIAVFYRNMWAMADLRERLKEYEDIGLTPKQLMEVDKLYAEKCKELAELQKRSFSGMELVKIWAKLKKFKEYQGLEVQGKLLKLPVAPGNMTYHAHKIHGITDASVRRIEIDRDGSWVITAAGVYSFDDFGKTVFLTKEKAEAKLKELRTADRT